MKGVKNEKVNIFNKNIMTEPAIIKKEDEELSEVISSVILTEDGEKLFTLTWENIENLKNLFQGCSSIISVDLSKINTLV